MKKFYDGDIAKSPRIQKLYDHLFEKMPEVEADRAVILTVNQSSQDVPKRLRQSVKNFQLQSDHTN